MKRQMITRKKFYDIRREYKELITKGKYTSKETRGIITFHLQISPSTLTRILKARNFQEYKLLGNLYSRLMKKLKRRVLFILGVLVVTLLVINLLIK